MNIINYISYNYIFRSLLILIFHITACEAQDNVYYRTSPYFPYKEFKYKHIIGEDQYIAEISLASIKESVSASSIERSYTTNNIEYIVLINKQDKTTDSFDLMYFIFLSREDAELFALEQIGDRHMLPFKHVNEYAIELGNNGWIDGNGNVVFIRDNVCVFLNDIGQVYPRENSITYAKNIDRYLQSIEKDSKPTRLHTPSIDDISVTSFEEKENSYTISATGEIVYYLIYTYNLHVTAEDNLSNILYYRAFGGTTLFYNNGNIFAITREKESPSKLWVMNENHLVASKDIFNSRRGER